ncbi:hypothetical protein GWI33_012491 [Rhynchophorus ferrugineus]|uniref:RING-type domain-containing protein n=1 Tax=Rhynchophorus ferrugineus TaxID=354439 RepID=A0A834ME50_RHYFE|nr:hypothetical protein GWI33_012491 [Rhynchophorus ferrugineus]
MDSQNYTISPWVLIYTIAALEFFNFLGRIIFNVVSVWLNDIVSDEEQTRTYNSLRALQQPLQQLDFDDLDGFFQYLTIARIHYGRNETSESGRGIARQQLDQLLTKVFISNTSRNVAACTVCLNNFEDKEILKVLPCNHEYHNSCIDRWLSNNRTCPLCRFDLRRIIDDQEEDEEH